MMSVLHLEVGRCNLAVKPFEKMGFLVAEFQVKVSLQSSLIVVE